jgi:arylsulfatase A-like enzyme
LERGVPNILWVVTTQWRGQACGFAGDPNARTPYLDALAQHAANFMQAVTPHPFGPFARAALLTGVPSPVNGVRDYFDPLPVEHATIAHQLTDAGYETAFFGKWHLAPRDREAALVGEAHAKTIVPPARRGGFGFWEGFESGFLLNDPWLHGTRLPEPTCMRGYQSDVLCERAASWIATNADHPRPWFCMVSLEAPHPPYTADAAGIAPPLPATLVLPPNVPREDCAQKAREELAGYYAHITATDRAIGRLIDTISFDDTVVIVTSVHGDMHGAHGLFRKGWPYEESVRVPLLVRVPDELGNALWGGRRDDLVSLINIPVWTRLWARRQQVATSPGGAQQISMPSVVPFAQQCDRAWRGVRTRVRKLIVTDDHDARGDPITEPWLYFDLQRDPWETTNLAHDPAHRAEIELLLPLINLPPAE